MKDLQCVGNACFHRDVTVKGWLEAANITGFLRGLYPTYDELKEKLPEPHEGWVRARGGDAAGDALPRVGAAMAQYGHYGGLADGGLARRVGERLAPRRRGGAPHGGREPPRCRRDTPRRCRAAPRHRRGAAERRREGPAEPQPTAAGAGAERNHSATALHRRGRDREPPSQRTASHRDRRRRMHRRGLGNEAGGAPRG